MAPLLADLVRRQPPAGEPKCREEEPATTLLVADWGGGAEVGQPSGFTCPECGGSLFESPGRGPDHFRCRTGHAYSPQSLVAKQSETLEATLWASMRALEESAALARRLEHRARRSGNDFRSHRYEERARRAESHAEQLRRILASREEGGSGDRHGHGGERRGGARLRRDEGSPVRAVSQKERQPRLCRQGLKSPGYQLFSPPGRQFVPPMSRRDYSR